MNRTNCPRQVACQRILPRHPRRHGRPDALGIGLVDEHHHRPRRARPHHHAGPPPARRSGYRGPRGHHPGTGDRARPSRRRTGPRQPRPPRSPCCSATAAAAVGSSGYPARMVLEFGPPKPPPRRGRSPHLLRPRRGAVVPCDIVSPTKDSLMTRRSDRLCLHLRTALARRHTAFQNRIVHAHQARLRIAL